MVYQGEASLASVQGEGGISHAPCEVVLGTSQVTRVPGVAEMGLDHIISDITADAGVMQISVEGHDAFPAAEQLEQALGRNGPPTGEIEPASRRPPSPLQTPGGVHLESFFFLLIEVLQWRWVGPTISRGQGPVRSIRGTFMSYPETA